MIELNFAFVIQLINFVVLIIILNKFLYKPIRKVLSDRRSVIDSAREKATSVDLEVQEKMALYEARLKDAKADALARKSEALVLAKHEETLLIENARKEATVSLSAIRDRIAKESAEAKSLLVAQSEVLSGVICEKILGRGL